MRGHTTVADLDDTLLLPDLELELTIMDMPKRTAECGLLWRRMPVLGDALFNHDTLTVHRYVLCSVLFRRLAGVRKQANAKQYISVMFFRKTP